MPSMEMCEALRAVTYNSRLYILEIGGGAGTRALLQLLREKKLLFTYVVYENNPDYLVDDLEVETVLWREFPETLRHPHTYDLVIVDGPHGVTREKWYPLLKPRVREGTIIAIDDFGHYPEFGQALDANFAYTKVAEFEPEARKGVTWKVVRVDGVK